MPCFVRGGGLRDSDKRDRERRRCSQTDPRLATRSGVPHQRAHGPGCSPRAGPSCVRLLALLRGWLGLQRAQACQ